MRGMLTTAILLAVSVTGKASSKCPWLTQGSATAILGGDVSNSVLVADDTSGSCHFLRRQAATTYELSVEVAQPLTDSCPPDSQKPIGIGTGALQCSVTPSPTHFTEQIDGQVRALHFRVAISTSGIRLSTAQRQSQRENLRRAAEEVAGNLF